MIALVLWVVSVWLLVCVPSTLIIVRVFRRSGVSPSMVASYGAAEAPSCVRQVPRPPSGAEPLISVPSPRVKFPLSA